jgi:DNA-binding NtrC family response regulator
LEQEVEKGNFREDLFFRLAVLGVHIPSLSERKEDIRILSEGICSSISKDICLSEEALSFLEGHDFPGNVRELRNILTRAYVLGGPSISVSSLQISPWKKKIPMKQKEANHGILRSTEERILREAFLRHQGNCSSMARDLGVPRTTLIYKLRRFGLSQKKETPAA